MWESARTKSSTRKSRILVSILCSTERKYIANISVWHTANPLALLCMLLLFICIGFVLPTVFHLRCHFKIYRNLLESCNAYKPRPSRRIEIVWRIGKWWSTLFFFWFFVCMRKVYLHWLCEENSRWFIQFIRIGENVVKPQREPNFLLSPRFFIE